jgi:hypothetical protein
MLGCFDCFSRVTADNKPEGFFSFHISGIILKSKVKCRLHPLILREGLLGRIEVLLYSCFNLGTLDGGGWSTPRPGRLNPRERPGVQEAGWALEPVWIGAENLAPTRIRSPDIPAHSESLYRLRHPSSSSLRVTSYLVCKKNRCHCECDTE